jgi:hypothetical protein
MNCIILLSGASNIYRSFAYFPTPVVVESTVIYVTTKVNGNAI